MQAFILGGAVATWAIVHSLLASNRSKQFVHRLFGAAATRGYRLTYNIVSAITLAPVAWLMWKMPDRALYSIPAPWSMFMWGVQTVAAILLALTLLQTNPLQFAGLSQILGRAEGSGLVSTGFYGIVRHPLYLLGLIFLWFAPHMSINQLAVSLALTAYLFIGALFEERRLEQEFGESYRQYRERTPMMFPAFSKRRSR